MTAVRAPMPPMKGIGISRPKRARLGTVCIIFANPSTGVRSDLTRVSKIPSGTPIKNRNAGREKNKKDVLAGKREQLGPVLF